MSFSDLAEPLSEMIHHNQSKGKGDIEGRLDSLEESMKRIEELLGKLCEDLGDSGSEGGRGGGGGSTGDEGPPADEGVTEAEEPQQMDSSRV